MTKTLEQLYCDGADEYWPARTAKVKAIRDYVKGLVKPEVFVAALAQEIMDLAEINGRIINDDVSGEIPASFTLDGNPNSFVV